MEIIGDEAKLTLDILENEHPESEDPWDQQWLRVRIKACLDGFQSCFEACVMRNELNSFVKSISKALDTQQGTVELHTLEESIYLRGTINYRGNVQWLGVLIHPVGMGSKLEFEFKTDFYQLQRIKESLARELSD